MELDLSKIHSIQFDGIDYSDAPEFCDAYIMTAKIDDENGERELTEIELEELNDDSDFVYEALQDYLY